MFQHSPALDLHAVSPRVPMGSTLVGGAAFMALNLWDFYVPGAAIRPFDFVAVAILILAIAFGYPHPSRIPRSALASLIAVWVIVLLYGLVGVFADSDNARPFLGALLGACALTAIVGWEGLTRSLLSRLTLLAIAVQCAAFWLQFSVYYLSGQVLNFHFWIGAEPRVFGGGFRACGLFLEPAHLSLTLFLLAALRHACIARVDKWFLLAAITAMASLSIWGIAAFVGLFLLLFGRSVILWLFVTAAGFGLVLMGSLVEAGQSFWLLRRILSIREDSSAANRYGGLFTSVRDRLWNADTWFGHGISNAYLDFGASGLAFTVHAVGFVGLVVMISVAAGFFVSERRWWLTYVLVVTLSATTVWTYMFWWFWLGAIIRLPREPREPRDVARQQDV